jgi:hypothetical protein
VTGARLQPTDDARDLIALVRNTWEVAARRSSIASTRFSVWSLVAHRPEARDSRCQSSRGGENGNFNIADQQSFPVAQA